jgi:hypothetical protein
VSSTTSAGSGETADDLSRLNRIGLALEYGTVGWNFGEAVLTVALGAAASSLALIGLGAVSVVEVFASAVVVWHLLPGHAGGSPRRIARATGSSPSPMDSSRWR